MNLSGIPTATDPRNAVTVSIAAANKAKA